MIEKLRGITNKKWFHLVIISVIIVILLFLLGVTILKYDVEGETNMPFKITKISIISTGEGIDKQSQDHKWAFDINQNNDIYIYLEKNEEYGKTETIKKIIIDNFNVEKKNKNGEVKIYKPDSTSEQQIFTSKEENVVNSIEYVGTTNSDFKNLVISNQGDLIAFRYTNANINTYQSNDDETINHAELLKKANLTTDDIKSTLSFDFNIVLDSGREYKANIKLDMPVENIIENGTGNTEITDLSDIIFKRIKN